MILSSSLLVKVIVTLIVGSLIWVGITLLLAFRKRKLLNMPIVKGGVPFFGQVYTMMQGSPWDTMEGWAKEYGPIFSFHLFGTDSVVVSDPDFLKYILQTKLTTFNKDLKWVYKPFLDILGNGIVTSHGESWRKQRVLLSHTLRIEILNDIPDMAIRAFERISKKLDACAAKGKTIDMAYELRHLTLQVIAEAILSISAEESDNTFAHMYLPIVEEANLRTWHPERTFLPTPDWFKYKNAVDVLDSYVTKLIKSRWELRKREHIEGTVTRTFDVLDKILGAIKEEEFNDSAIKQVREEVKTFILAGHETSASMLTWSIYELTQNPDFLVELRAEVETVIGNYASCEALSKTSRDWSKLVYAESCLRESLRKYSVVPSVVRICDAEVQYQGHTLPKDTCVMINIQAVHHDEKFWPEPKKYIPDRFLKEITPYTFLPFIEGPRMCLGQYLSLLESKIVLSLLVKNYDFTVVNADAGEKHPFMVPIIPKSGHVMKVTKRKVK